MVNGIVAAELLPYSSIAMQKAGLALPACLWTASIMRALA
jgi:hypothetical protein